MTSTEKSAAETINLIVTTLIFEDHLTHTTFYLGQAVSEEILPVCKLVSMLGLTDKTFRKFGSKIPWGDLHSMVLDPSYTKGMEMFNVFKEKWLVFQTPRGVRKLSIPDIGCTEKAIYLRRPELLNDLRLDDIIGETAHTLDITDYSYDDYIIEKFAVEMDSGDRIISWGKYDTFKLAVKCVTDVSRVYHREVMEEGVRVQIFLERMKPSGLSERILIQRNGRNISDIY